MNERFKYGIVFWSGVSLYTLINIMYINLTQATVKNLNTYNIITFCVSIFAIGLNYFLMKKSEEKKIGITKDDDNYY